LIGCVALDIAVEILFTHLDVPELFGASTKRDHGCHGSPDHPTGGEVGLQATMAVTLTATPTARGRISPITLPMDAAVPYCWAMIRRTSASSSLTNSPATSTVTLWMVPVKVNGGL
jgi:hypothetical protein